MEKVVIIEGSQVEWFGTEVVFCLIERAGIQEVCLFDERAGSLFNQLKNLINGASSFPINKVAELELWQEYDFMPGPSYT